MFRFLLPGLFLLVAILFLAVYVLGAGGHGPNPFDFVINFLFPACLLVELLGALGGPELLWMLLCFVAATLQYFLLGYAIDWLIRRRRKHKQSA
jgi:hypothetical protein